MEKAFPFLTRHDNSLLDERAKRAIFAPGDIILEEGSKHKNIFTVRNGMVRVVRSYQGQAIVVARLGISESFGEMSFIDGQGASASVIAEESVEVDIFDEEALQSLLVSEPGFATRFYMSLTKTLCQRMRDTAALLPSMMVEDVPQVRRFHSERTGQLGQSELPNRLIEDVERFKTSLLATDRAMIEGPMDEMVIQFQVNEACDGLEESLRTHIQNEQHLEKAIGAYVFRETFPYFMRSRTVDRAFMKPRGYAGDYWTIEMMCVNEPEGDGRLGEFIDRWMLARPAIEAIRRRSVWMTETIRQMALDWSHMTSMPITALASGTARELFDFFLSFDAPKIHATCVDIDPEALSYNSERAKALGIFDSMTFAQDNVVRLSRGKGKIGLAPQKLIYSVGLLDYLEDLLALQLINWIYDHLQPGGIVIFGNFDASNPTRAFFDHILEWVLLHRSAEQLKGLFSMSQFREAPVSVHSVEEGTHLFVSCRKPEDVAV